MKQPAYKIGKLIRKNFAFLIGSYLLTFLCSQAVKQALFRFTSFLSTSATAIFALSIKGRVNRLANRALLIQTTSPQFTLIDACVMS
jgi:hypothetical protein